MDGARKIFVVVGALSFAVPVTVLAVRRLIGLDKPSATDKDSPARDLKQSRPSAVIEQALESHPVFKNVGAPESPISIVANDSFVTAFNRQTRTACWSCERLSKSVLKAASSASGSTDEVTREKSSFTEPLDQPELFRPRNEDYMHSGYDRGHLVPAADLKSSQDAMDRTFSLTNVAPQVGVGFNRGYWARFEYMVRGLTKKYDDVFVCTGPAFIPEELAEGKHYVMYQVLGSPPNVAVPTHFWKVIVATRSGTRKVVDSEMKDGKATPADDASTSQEPVLIIAKAAFLLPNEDMYDAEMPIERFLVDQSKIEKAIGTEFFPRVKRQEAGRRIVDLCTDVSCKLPPENFWNKDKTPAVTTNNGETTRETTDRASPPKPK